MIKYTFLIYHKDYEHFLSNLQEIGLVHVVDKKQEICDALQQSLETVSHLREVQEFLQKRDVEKHPDPDDMDGRAVMEKVNELRDYKNDLLQQQKNLSKQMRQAEPWGDFSNETLQKLKEKDIKLHFFQVEEKEFDPQWEQDYHLTVINRIGGELYFVIFTYGDETIDIGAEEVPAPPRPVSAYKEEYRELEQKLQETEEKLDDYAARYQDSIEEAIANSQEETDLMDALENTEAQADNKVMMLEGWVPAPKEQELLNFLENEDVLYVKGETSKEKAQNIPVMLKNNKFSTLFEDIGGMFSLPHAREIDMTPFFAPFFAMFFGFCLGDAGYGILYLIVAEIVKRKKPELKSIMSMLQVLGATTVIFGILTGTVFGIMVPQNEYLLQLSEPLREYRDAFISNQELFNLALYVGIIQIIFGMFLKVANKVKQYGWLYAVSTMGWILLILSSLVTFAFLPESANTAFMPFYKGLAILSGIMILFFNNPDAGILGSLGAGIWDTYQMITGLLGDLLSYIRLFALGIASAILGFVFNQMAISLSPSFPVAGQLVFVLILLLGHSINIFMSSLGALIHPMRLTFVEFYKNAGFEGGGQPYQPLQKQTHVKQSVEG